MKESVGWSVLLGVKKKKGDASNREGGGNKEFCKLKCKEVGNERNLENIKDQIKERRGVEIITDTFSSLCLPTVYVVKKPLSNQIIDRSILTPSLAGRAKWQARLGFCLVVEALLHSS
ncbi:hypothetical protein E2542_SST14371 [Spatholobus suberectus]|nr:hypothetical protein E2542_SST14371 [Spatholobus suberectus]